MKILIQWVKISKISILGKNLLNGKKWVYVKKG